MKLLLIPLLLFISFPLNAQTSCYKKGHSHVCTDVTDEGEINITECYWMGDSKFCRINNGDLRRVY